MTAALKMYDITNKAQTYTILLIEVMSEMGRGEGRERKLGGAEGGGGD